MIIIHEGVPGAGKSFDAVRKILSALKKGRRVYTNIDGMDRPECLEYIAGFCQTTRDDLIDQLFFIEKGKIQHFWDFIESGSLIVIDEAQLYFNSRDFTKTANREFSDWASTHRHHGYDLILITQRAERIDTAVRSLAEFKYRYRKLTFLGSMFDSGFMVYNFIGDDPKHMSYAKRTYDKQIFPAYNSYVGDASEQKFHKAPNVFKHPIFFSIPVVFAVFIYFATSSNLFSNPLNISAKKPVLSKTESVKNPFNPFQKASAPASAGVETIVDADLILPVLDPLIVFPVDIYMEQKKVIYLTVHGVLIRTFEQFDNYNMVVGIRKSKIPAGLQLKLEQIESAELAENTINKSEDLTI